MARRWLATSLALALTGCTATVHPLRPHGPVASPAAATVLAPPGQAVAGIISEQGGAVVSDTGGSLTGKVKMPAGVIANNAGNIVSDHGAAVIANNAGNVVANNAGNIIANHAAGLHLLDVADLPLSGAPVTIVDAAGHPVLDAKGQPYRATTGPDGGYTFAHTPRGANLVVRVELPPAVGPMLAFLPNADAGKARQADVGAASTLVMGYVLEKFVKGQPDPVATLQKLPADVEATTRAKAASALGDETDVKSFRPEVVVPEVEALKQAHADFAQQVEIVRKLLIAGLSDVGDGQAATAVALSMPKDLAWLPDGSLLVAERDGHRVRRLDLAAGTVTTVAGKDGASDAGNGGPATEAFVDRPVAIATDAKGNIYICDFGHHQIRRVDAATHVITAVAGTGTGSKDVAAEGSLEGLDATKVDLKFPRAVAVDAKGRVVFVAENGVLRLETNGKLHSFDWPVDLPNALATGPDCKVYAYVYQTGRVVSLDGDAPEAVDLPAKPAADGAHLAIGSDGSYYLSDDTKLWHCKPGGDWQEVPFTTAHGELEGLFVAADALYVCDAEFNRVWRLPAAGGAATAVAGLDATNADALAANALSLNRPGALVLDAPGHLLVADGLNGLVWERRPDGLFYRFAGGAPATAADTDIGDGGPARSAKLLKVASLARLHDGTVLIGEADLPVLRVRAIDPSGTIATRSMPDGMVAPAFMVEQKDGSILASDYALQKLLLWKDNTATPVPGTDVIKRPAGIALAPDGSYYVADAGGGAVWHVADGKATLIAGGPDAGFAGDGGPASAAQFANPLGVALAANGDLYVVDTKNDRVRRIRDGQIQTVVGAGGVAFAGSGPDDSLKEPVAAVFDTNGDLYVSDSGHNQVKRVEADKLK